MGQLSLGFVANPQQPRLTTCFYYADSQAETRNLLKFRSTPVKSDFPPKDLFAKQVSIKRLTGVKRSWKNTEAEHTDRLKRSLWAHYDH